MSNISKRSTMNKSWCVFCRLHKIRHQSITHKDCDSTSDSQITDTEWLTVRSDSQQYIFNTMLQIFLTGCQTKDCHQFWGRGDVKTCFRHDTITSQTSYNITKSTIVNIQHTFPINLTQRKPFLTMLVDIIVQYGTNRVMCGGDSMEVTRKMQVDLLHR